MTNIGLPTALNRRTSAYSFSRVANQHAPDCALLAKPLHQRLVVKWSDTDT